ncbi:hypothetical protein GCM10007940_32830 [Portibacter lacus]|uniref:Uncharacterized protein n=1 Tax=Portibacter lacus TaxID=1099794 RepID=A0AA37SRL8_9BACT|nr:hypothetical protein GCM10007940_32830 [Portibacter lacus]
MQRNQQYVFKSLHHKDIELLSLMLDFLVDSQKKVTLYDADGDNLNSSLKAIFRAF